MWIFEHNFVAGKAKIRRRAVARQVFFTQDAAKFAEKTLVYACEDRFLLYYIISLFLFSIVNSEKICYNHTDNQLHRRRMEGNILCFTVILADDEPQILEGIRDSVEWETLGFRVIATALNGKELLEQLSLIHI